MSQFGDRNRLIRRQQRFTHGSKAINEGRITLKDLAVNLSAHESYFFPGYEIFEARANPIFWRESWLKRIDPEPGASMTAASTTQMPHAPAAKRETVSA